MIFDDNMTSVKPYLVRALYEWISDNQLTPLVVADATLPGVKVPEQAIEDGKVVLNISMTATEGFSMENEHISFSARFAGKAFMLDIPMAAVTAIYARENSKGMMFDVDPDEYSEPAEESTEDGSSNQDDAKNTKKPNKKKSHLKLVD